MLVRVQQFQATILRHDPFTHFTCKFRRSKIRRAIGHLDPSHEFKPRRVNHKEYIYKSKMTSTDPHPRLWTLRLKQHKTTILLYVEQTQSFISIKSDLLDALKKCGREELNGNALPSDPEDVIFGIPVDKNDISKGWIGLDIPAIEVEDNLGSKKKVGGKKSVLNASPVGAGLKDGGMLAFKFRREGALVDEDGMDMDDNDWDVIMPTYEEEAQSQT